MIRTRSLHYNFPEELVALRARPRGDSRLFLIPRDSSKFGEISWKTFFDLFTPGDVLVLNDTKVLKARLLMGGREVFFLKALGPRHWQVLTKGVRVREGKEIVLPGGLRARFLRAGKPAEILLSDDVDLALYLEKHGHVPLPPYILALRESGSDLPEDVERYQTFWATRMGSVAAPTASLHFGDEHLAEFKRYGVDLRYVTLHVGAGTFLPLDVENIDDFRIHSELMSVGGETVEAVLRARAAGRRVWACGTTVLRALESLPDLETSMKLKSFDAETSLFVKPGFKFRFVDGLLTNFHQPESSLLLLAAAFAGHGLSEEAAVEKILSAYRMAIELRFRLFSYGDLTVIC